MTDVELAENLKSAVEQAWGQDTCYPPMADEWKLKHRSWGQCAVTAVIVQDYLGGALCYCRHWHHYWNELPSGEEVDWTLGQFAKRAMLCADGYPSSEDVLHGDGALKARTFERYSLLSARVKHLLIKERE